MVLTLSVVGCLKHVSVVFLIILTYFLYPNAVLDNFQRLEADRHGKRGNQYSIRETIKKLD